MARQREGDVATFHFMDNVNRAIRHTGRCMLDLIPYIYNTPRIIRTIGEDGSEEAVQVNQEFQTQDKQGMPIVRLHDLTKAKYDITISTGPSYTTRRQEAADNMTEVIRAYPASAPVVAPLLAKNLDWPGAEEMAEKFEQQASGQMSDEVKQKFQEAAKRIETLQKENVQLKEQTSQFDMAMEGQKNQLEAEKIANDRTKMQMETEVKIRELELKNRDLEHQIAQYQVPLQSAQQVAQVAEQELRQVMDQVLVNLEGIAQQVAEIRAMQLAPRALVRDDMGNVVGVESEGLPFRSVVRNGSGEITGLEVN